MEVRERTPTLEQMKEQQFTFAEDRWTVDALSAHCAGLKRRVDQLPPEETLDTDRELQHALFELVMRQGAAL